MRNPSLRPFPGPPASPRITESSSFPVQGLGADSLSLGTQEAPAGPVAAASAANEA